MLGITTVFTMTNAAIRRDELAHRAAIAESINRILAGERFERDALSELAVRNWYPAAVRCLVQKISFRRYGNMFRTADPVALLLDRAEKLTLPFRLAQVFGVASTRGNKPFGIDHLRELAKRSERARIALAAWGAVDWPNASCEVRAAFLLGELVRLHRDRDR